MSENQLSDELLHPEFWKNRWREAKEESTLYSQTGKREKFLEFWNSISGFYKHQMAFESTMASGIIDLLAKEGVLHDDSVVLDIGSGPGTFAVPMAPRVSNIVALDPAHMMLDLLKREAREKGITNICPVCVGWEDCNYKKEFDFVFAAFSTCINEAAMLEKMNEASRGHACLIGFFKTEEKILRDELWGKIMKTPYRSNTLNLIYPLNLLLTSGFRPNLKFFKYSFEHQVPVEQLVLRYKSFFNIFNDVDDKTEEIIYGYFQARSEDGIFKNQINREICVMWWEAENR